MPEHTSETTVVKNASRSVWGHSPAGWTYGNNHQPGTKEFFESVLRKRFSEETPWMDDIVKFERFCGKRVLEIGCGCGYDAYQFCKHGALYTGIDITPENIERATNHLTAYGYAPTILEMDAEQMHFITTFDYVFSFGVLHHTPDMQKVFNKVYDALVNEGEFQVILYHRNSLFYQLNVILYRWILRGGFLHRSLAQQRSLIEYSESSAHPLVNVYSSRQVAKLLRKSGFRVVKTEVRKLVHEDIPGPKIVRNVINKLPQSWLNWLGRRWGWYVSVRAVKEASNQCKK